MPNTALLRTTMDLVDASPDHDNREYARRKPGEEPTYCFATFAILNVHPDAEVMWCKYDAEYASGEGVPYGTEYGSMVLLPDGMTRGIETLAQEMLELERGDRNRLFDSGNTKDELRAIVDELAPQ